MVKQVNRRQVLALIGGALAAVCETKGSAMAEGAYRPEDFTIKYAKPGREGIVVGVPYAHQNLDPLSQVIGGHIAEKNGFGIVSSYVQSPFKIYYPAEGLSGSIRKNDFTSEARAVYNQFLSGLKEASVSGKLDHSFIIINARRRKHYPYVDALTAGYSPDERRQMERMYDSLLSNLPQNIRRRDLLFLRDDRVKYLYPDMINEGVLLHPNRGMAIVTSQMDEETAIAYASLFSDWTDQIAKTFKRNPNIKTFSLDDEIFGRFTKVPGKSLDAIVTAPHGGDTFSDAIAENIARSLDIDALIVNGFNTTSWGNWQRVNISRPTEDMTRYENESHTERAKRVFDLYLNEVAGLIEANSAPILVEIHTNWHGDSQNSVQIASQGLSFDGAQAIAHAYEQAMHGEPLSLVDRLPLEIEPMHEIYMNAMGTKEVGIFNPGVTGINFPIALQIELPLRKFYSSRDNGPGNLNLRSYTRIMAEVVRAAISLNKS